MPDRDVALQGGESGLVEDLADQAEVLVDEHERAVADRDAGGFLAAVLQRVEAEVGELGDLLARRPDAEDAARVLRAGVLGIDFVAELAVRTGHPPILRARAIAGAPHRRGAADHPAASSSLGAVLADSGQDG